MINLPVELVDSILFYPSFQLVVELRNSYVYKELYDYSIHTWSWVPIEITLIQVTTIYR